MLFSSIGPEERVDNRVVLLRLTFHGLRTGSPPEDGSSSLDLLDKGTTTLSF